MKVTIVHPLPDYKLQVSFDDGVSGVIDLKTYIEDGIFFSLKNEESFNKVYTNGYSVAWNNDLEIDALTIYVEITKRDLEDILTTNYFNVGQSVYNAEFISKIEDSREQVKRGETRPVNIADL